MSATRTDHRVLALAVGVLATAGCGARSPVEPTAGPSSWSRAKQHTGDGTDGSRARTACTATYECTLVDRDPCACGMRGARDVEALATAWSEDHPSSPTGSCPDCISEPNLDLLPTCRAGRCRVLDVASSSLSNCTSAPDCVAVDAGCCPPCGPYWHWVAVNRDRAERLRRQLCGPDWATMGCPACASPVAPTPTVSCEAGHCRVGRDG